jgi:hypothetical protein
MEHTIAITEDGPEVLTRIASQVLPETVSEGRIATSR